MRRFYTDEAPIDTLLQLFERADLGVWDGDLISKCDRDSFVLMDWCARDDRGMNYITAHGCRVVNALKLARVETPDPDDFAEVGETREDLAKRITRCETTLEDLVRDSSRTGKQVPEIAGLLGKAEIDIRKLQDTVYGSGQFPGTAGLDSPGPRIPGRPEFAEAWDEAGRVAAQSSRDGSTLYRVVCALIDNMPPIERRGLLRFITDRKLEEF
jgi:hypothetical protein